jgi:transcriptional regulator with XRE-family HTH domain
MGERQIFYEELGLYFEALREGKGWKQTVAAGIARRRKLTGLSYNAIRYLEAGKTKHPDAKVLRAAAQLYSVPYEELVIRYVAAHYDVHLVPECATAEKALPATPAVIPFAPAERKLLAEFRRLDLGQQQAVLSLLRRFGDQRPKRRRPGAAGETQSREGSS